MLFKALGGIVARFWPLVIAGWITLAAVLVTVSPPLGKISSDKASFLPPASDSIQAKRLLDCYFPADSFESRIVLAAEKETPLTQQDLEWLDTTANSFAQDSKNPIIRKVLTPLGTPFLKDKLVSKDGKAAMAVLTLSTYFIAKESKQLVATILRQIKDPPNGISLAATGDAVIGSDYHRALGESLNKTTTATVLMLIGILVFIFRSPITPLVSLVSIVVSFLVSKSICSLLALAGATVSPMTEILLVVVVFGAGSNYCVFLIFRYYEEICGKRTSPEAAAAAVRTVGQAISASAFTVIIGLGSLFFTQFGPFSQTGPYVAIGVAVALCAGLTLTPSLILALRKILFWPSGTLRHELEPMAWKRIAGFVTRKPAVTCATLLLGLAPLIYFGVQSGRSFDLLRELPESFTSLRGMEILKRHFSQGEMSPLVLVLKTDTNLKSPMGLDRIHQLTAALSGRKEIQEVRSAVWPTGDPKLLEEGLLINQVEKMGSSLGRLIEGTEKIHGGIDQIREKANAFEQSLGAGVPSKEQILPADIAKASEQAYAVRQELDKAISSLEGYQEEARKKAREAGFLVAGTARPEYQRAIEKLQLLSEGLKQIRDGLTNLGTRAQEASSKINEALAQAQKQQEQAQEKIAQLQEALKKLSDGILELSEGLRVLCSAMQNLVSPQSPAQDALNRLVLPPDILEKQPKLKEATDYYISPDSTSTRITLILRATPYSRQEKDDILSLKEFVKEKTQDIFGGPCDFHFAGAGSTNLDKRIVTDKDFYRIIAYVLGGIFLVLLFLVGGWLAPTYLIGTMIFSYFVTLGLTSLVFEHGMRQEGLDWKTPFFLFVLLVALGEDYNIYLVARIKEEKQKLGLLEGVRTAVVRTGPLITFCGLIMAGTFLSLMLSPLEALIQLGFGITIGVLLDTFIVRPLLVPSLVILADKLKRGMRSLPHE